MARHGKEALGAAVGYVVFLSEDGTELELVAVDGYDGPELDRFRRFSADADLPVCDAVRRRQPILLPDPATRLELYPHLGDGSAMGFEAWCAIPVFVGDRVLGALTLSFAHPRAFSAADRELMLTIARQSAQTVERARLFEEEKLARERLAAANQMLEAVISASPAGIWLADPDGTVRLWNRAAERMFGWPAEEVLGRFLPVVPQSEREGFLRNLARVAAGESLMGEEVRRLRRDGAPIDVQLWGAPVARPDGRVQCLFVVADITERKRAEAALRAADQRKDEFLAMLGHELRNPLAPILTAVELMDIRGETATERERRIIGRQLRHLVRLVDDLLDVSRITRGRIELRRQRVELHEALARALEMTAPAVEAQRHRLEVAAPPGLFVDGDADRLAQVFANLLANAARYTPVGGHLALQARAEGDTVVVTVTDDGAGIAPELLPDVFELFVQGGRTSDRAQGGLGIGLTLVKSLVERHGGRVAAHSDGPGRGSRFTVTLPAAAAPEPAPEGLEAPPARAGHGRRVLVVDDNHDALEMMAEALGRQGFQVTVASDALSALMAARSTRPEVAVLDIGLPEVDGYELAAKLRRELGARPLRLIALSGYGQERDREKSRAAGFDAHFVKPVDLAALERALRDPPGAEPRG